MYRICLLFTIVIGCFPVFLVAQSNCDSLLQLGKQFFQLEKYEKVIDLLKDCNENKDQMSTQEQREIKNTICLSCLELSKGYFEKGRLNKVVDRLKGCTDLRDSYHRPTQREVLSLLAETYQFLDLHEEAELTYADLLYLDPFYVSNSPAPEMIQLRNKFETIPSTAFTVYGGLYLQTRPVNVTEFAVDGVNILDETYTRQAGDIYSWVTGFSFDLNLDNTSVFLTLGYSLSSTYFRYNGTYDNALNSEMPGMRGRANVTFQERNRWSHLPLMIKWLLPPKASNIRRRVIPYIYSGVAFEFIHSNTSALLGPEITFENQLPNSLNEFGLGARRNNFNVAFLTGFGVKYKLRRYFIAVDLRYNQTLRNHVDDQTRFSSSDLQTVFNYADNDFSVRKLGFSVGVGAFLFRSIRKD